MADLHAHIFLEPNWRSSVTVSWEFRTDIFATREGYETRSSLREFPRMQTTFNLLTGRNSDPGWTGIMASGLSKRVGFPDLTRRMPGEALSSNFLDGDFDTHRLPTGAGAFVEASGVFYRTQVEANSGSILQLSSALPVGAGDEVWVYPELSGRIAEDFQARYRVSSASEADVTFEAFAAQDRVKELIGWEPTSWYRNRPVALWAPNWADRVQESWSRMELGFDTGYGVPWFEAKMKSPIRTGAYRAVLKTTEEIDEIVSFFCYCRGRQASFYAPTWVDDFIFTEPVSTGQTLVRVRGQSALKLFQGSDTFRNIALRRAGSLHLSAIQDLYSVGTDCELVLAEPVPEAFSGATRASWLIRQRFASDSLELDFRTDRVAEVDIKTISLIEDFEVVKIDKAELTIGGYYVTIGSIRDIENDRVVTANGYSITVGGDFLE